MTRRRRTTRRRKTTRRRRTGGLLNPNIVVKPRPRVEPLGGYEFQKRRREHMMENWPLKKTKGMYFIKQSDVMKRLKKKIPGLNKPPSGFGPVVLSSTNQTKGFPAIQPHVEAWSKLQKGWRR